VLTGATLTSIAIGDHSHSVSGEPGDYDSLLDLIGDRRQTS
jgi:hypothetical protein